MFAILKSMRCLIGSQWSCWRRVRGLHDWVEQVATRARRFWAFWSLEMFLWVAPNRTAHIWFQLTTHFIDPEGMKGWVGLVSWPIADGLPTLVVTHQLQVERRTGKVRQSKTDVLPLCHATNLRTKRYYALNHNKNSIKTKQMQQSVRTYSAWATRYICVRSLLTTF